MEDELEISSKKMEHLVTGQLKTLNLSVHCKVLGYQCSSKQLQTVYLPIYWETNPNCVYVLLSNYIGNHIYSTETEHMNPIEAQSHMVALTTALS